MNYSLSLFKPLRTLCLVLLGAQLLVACQHDEISGPPEINPPNSGVPVTLQGTVLDEDGHPVAGATVKADGKQVTTAPNGTFSLADVKTGAGNMLLVDCSKNGYRKQIRRVAGGKGRPWLMIAMPLIAQSITFNAAAGGKAELTGGARVSIPADAVVREDGSVYTGQVWLAVAHIDPADPDFSLKIPGSDLSAVRTDNSNVNLYSYGMLDIDMTTEDGKPLQLKTGKQASLRFPVAASQRVGAPASMPLWHFDEAKGIWKEEGSATLNGTHYEGNVSHFSTWNVDVPAKMATVKGKVTDACANNAPVKGVTVYLGQTLAITDDEGNYTARVVAGMAFKLSISGRYGDGRSFTRDVPAVNEGTSSTQDVSFACAPTLEGRITFCATSSQLTNIRLEHNNKVIAFVFSDAQHRFRVFAPQGQVVNLTAFGPDGAIASRTVVMPNSNTVTDLGDIEMCVPKPVAATEFTVKQGTQETPYKLEGGRAQAINQDNRTDCTIAAGQITLGLKFEGVATGVYPNGQMVLSLNGKTYVSEKMQITVTKYGPMSEVVEGTFSGVATPFSGVGDNVEIKNGKFTALRILG